MGVTYKNARWAMRQENNETELSPEAIAIAYLVHPSCYLGRGETAQMKCITSTGRDYLSLLIYFAFATT